MYERKRVNTLAPEYEQVLDIYEGDTYGNVYGNNGIELKQSFNSTGYKQVSLKLKNERRWKKCFVHRLVGYGFVKGKMDEKNEIDHIDTIKTNNKWYNLRWTDRTGNMENPMTRYNMYAINGKQCYVYDFKLNFIGKYESLDEASKKIGRSIRGINTRVLEYYILDSPDLNKVLKINKKQKIQSVVITNVETKQKFYFYSNREARKFFDNKINITQAIQKNWTVRGKYKVRNLNYKKLIGMLDL